MKTLDYNQLRLNLKQDTAGFQKTSLALLGDTATQTLCKAIKGYGVAQELAIEVFQLKHDHIDLAVHNPLANFYQQPVKFVFIYQSVSKLREAFYTKTIAEQAHFASDIIQQTTGYIQAINQQINTTIILSNFMELPDMVFNNFGNKVKHSWIYQIRTLNVLLMDLAGKNNNVHICDLSSLQNQVGRNQSFDPQLFTRTSIDTSLNFQSLIAQSLVSIINAGLGKFKKCLILDLDNTLWGGIIGDDGIEGIELGGLGDGKAFLEIQHWAKNLKERGILLAICSKNSEKIAKAPFESHPEMVLTLADIAVFVANWENKADNIRYIQSILQIGFDSMVFLDDNPFERNLIRLELPRITVPELPSDPTEYIPYLQQFQLFETITYAGQDQERTKQYQQEVQRKKQQPAFTSISEYLESLNMQAKVLPFDEFQTPRIAQLTQRSNQFNLRTIRYTEQEINTLSTSTKHETRYFSLTDKFGDYGLIGLLILEIQDTDKLFIDTWIMSCRVLNRGVELFMLNELVKIAEELNATTIIGERIPTIKNELVVNHFKDLGFLEKERKWYLSVSEYQPKNTFISKEEVVIN